MRATRLGAVHLPRRALDRTPPGECERICCVAETVDRRTNIRLDESASTTLQRL